jgi:C4-dicarboxylate-binding protein DctP
MSTDTSLRGMLRRACLAAALVAALPAGAAPLFRISLENTLTHVQVKAVQRFAADLQARAGGSLEVQLFAEARLFRDRDVVPALVQEKIEMAVPGTWQIDRFVPAVGVPLLPVFYGRSPDWVDGHMAGRLGQEIARRIEEGTGTVVVGRWIDLGPVHLFGTARRFSRHEDIRGARIRFAGGLVNEMRLKALGAEPVLIPWPDLPEKLRAGEVEGVLTSFETVASARLWEAGIRSALEASQYVGQYVPLVSGAFWKRIPAQLRRTIRDAWEANVDAARSDAAAAQADARRLLLESGVQVTVPPPAEVERWRTALMARQPDMIRALGIDDELARLIPAP